MKKTPQLIELSLCLVCALAPVALFTLQANSVGQPQTESVRAYDREVIEGKVGAKSDTTLTVDSKTIAVSVGTLFTKDGKAITLGDIQKGAQVRVKVSKGTDGSLQALSVEVLANK